MNIREIALADLDLELATMRRFLERVPDDKMAWRLHDKSMTLGRLSMHCAEVPRGTLALDLDARSLEGMAALIGKFSAPVADRIRRTASRSVPVKLHTSLSVDRDAAMASGGSTLAKFKLQGSAGVFRLDLQGDAGGSTVASTDLARLGASKVRLTGLIDAGDGGARAHGGRRAQ